MKKSKYTEEQIAFALKQVELGTPIGEVCRKLGVTEQTFYRWKKKYESADVRYAIGYKRMLDNGLCLRSAV